MSENELRRQSRYTWLLVAFSALVIFFMAQQSRAQTTNTLVMQDANFATQVNSGGDFFNNGSTELGMWANSGSKQTAGWANFGASGFGGTARNLQVGDVFTITVSATRAFGQIGFSLNNGGTQGTSYANNISGSRLYVNTDNYGSWYVGGLANAGTSSFNYNPSQDTYRDYQFKVFITSETTGYVELYVNGTYNSTAYNLNLGGSAGENISALSIYGSDMWDGNSNDNAYWKQTSTIVDNGSVNIGYNLGGTSTFNPGVIADGLVANSATSVRTNSVNIGGDSGSIVILDDSSTYEGNTTINAAATARAGNANAFGTNGTVTVTSGGRVQMSNGITIARSLVLNGDGISTSGALQNINGNNTWSGAITNNGSARINSDTGTLTISGAISNAASQSLYFGGAGNVTADGAITGTLTTGNGALYKDGAGNLTLSANNSGLTGLVRIKGGTVTITNGNSLGTGSVEFGSGSTLTTLQVNSNTTVANRFELDNNVTNAVINVATNITATFSGILSQTNGTVNTNKFGKDGAGTLIFNNAGGTYNGQIQIGQGTVILGATAALGTNANASNARGVDLGLNVGDTATTNNVSLLASNGVTVGQSIYVATNSSSATRTIGLSGNGTNTFTNQFYLDGSLTVAVGAAATDRVNLTANITNTGGLIKTGSGFLNLSASNSYTGGTTLALGSTEGIIIGHDNAFGTGGVTNLAAGGTFQVDTTRAVANNFRLDSSSTLFTGSGSLTINGTLSIAASPDLTNNLTGGLTLGNLTLGSSATSRTLTIKGTGNTVINGVVANAASQTTNNFTISSSGITSLNGNNTYTGATTISSGATVKLGHANGLGSTNSGTSISSGGALDLNGQTSAAEAITGSGTGVSSSGLLFNSSASAASLSGAVTMSGNSTVAVTNGAITLSGIISESLAGRALTKTGTGTLTLSGANSFGGGVTLSAGTLVVDNNAALGTGAADFTTGVFLNSANTALTIANDITFRNLAIGGTGAVTFNGTLTHTAANNTLTNNNAGGLTFGALNLSGTSTSRTMTLAGTGNTIFNGVIANGPSATSGGLTVNSSGTTTLNGANTFSGALTLDGGTLVVGNNSAFGTGTVALGTSANPNVTLNSDSTARTLTNAISFRNLTVGGTGALTLNGTLTQDSGSYTLTNNNSGGLTLGAINISSASTARTLTIVGSGNTVISGTIANGSTATSGNLIVNSSGLTTLSGSNSFGGDTTINGGTLVLSGTNSGSGSVLVAASNAVFKIGKTNSLVSGNLVGASSSANTGTVDLTGGGNYSVASLGNSAAVAGNINFTNSSGLATTLTFTAATNVISSGSNGSKTVANNSANLNLVFNGVVDIGGTGSTNGVTFDGAGNHTFNGAIISSSGTRNLVKSGSGTLTLNAANTYNGATIVNAGTVQLGGSGTLGLTSSALTIGSGTVNLGGLSLTNGAFTLDSGTLSNGTLTASSYALTNAGTVSAVLAGSGALTKSGAGTAVLSGANSYSGGTTISAGTLQGDTTSLNGGVTNNATLLISQTTSGTYAGDVSGTGAVTVDGNGTGVVALSGNNTFGGLTTVNNGTLKLGSSNALGSGGTDWTTTGIKLGAGGILDLNGQNIANEALAMNSTTAAVTNSSTTTAVWGGAIALTNSTNQFNVAAGKDITLNGSITYGTASRTLVKNGDGVLTVAGSANTNSGAILINGGTYRMGHATALGSNGTSNDVTVAVGATLDLNGYTAVTTIKPIKLSGTGVSGAGALQNSASGSTATVNNDVVLNADSTIGTVGNISVGGALSGAGILTKIGAGTLNLNSANTYSGGTVLTAGTIGLGSSTALGTGTVTLNGGTIGSITSARTLANNFVIGANVTFGTGDQATVFNGNFDLGGANRTLTLGNSVTFNGNITNGGMVFNAGSGGVRNITLGGSNSFAGGMTVNGGNTVRYTNGNSLGTGGVTLNSNSILRATNNTTTTADITVTTGNTGYVEAAAGTTNTLNGTLSKNGSVLVLGGGGTHIVNGSITGASANSDLVVSNATATINSTNSYNGPTFVVAAGTLNNGTNNALPTDTALTLGQAGETSSTTNTYNLNGYSQTVASVATAGSSVNVVTNSTGSGNLTLNSSVDKNISNLKMGGSGLTLTKSGANTVTLVSGNTIGPGTIAIQQGTLLLGAANQIGDSTAITLSGGKLNTAGYADAVGKLTVSANSTIQGLNSTSGSAFTFSDIDLGNYSTSSGSTLTLLPTSGTYSLGTVIQLSTLAASSWTGYSETSLNNFRTKISFNDANLKAQINFGGGTSGTTLTVAAIPEPKVYMAAAGLVMLIAYAEVRRRRKAVSSKV